MTTVELLKAAKAKIADPEHWTKRWFARTATDAKCMALSVRAVKWCAVGACETVGADYGRAWSLLRENAPGGSLPALNDAPETTHADIMALFDRAIEAAEQEEG